MNVENIISIATSMIALIACGYILFQNRKKSFSSTISSGDDEQQVNSLKSAAKSLQSEFRKLTDSQYAQTQTMLDHDKSIKKFQQRQAQILEEINKTQSDLDKSKKALSSEHEKLEVIFTRQKQSQELLDNLLTKSGEIDKNIENKKTQLAKIIDDCQVQAREIMAQARKEVENLPISRVVEELPKPASNALLKTVQEQEKKIEFLQAQLSNYKRDTQGVYLKWATPREDKAAYLLRIYNDSYGKIYNIKHSVDPKYADFMKLFSNQEACESEKSVNLFFVPGTWKNIPQQGPTADRLTFVEKWIENRMEPIKFIVEYSTDPISNTTIQLEIFFTKDNLTSNFRSVLHSSRNNLTLLP